MLWLMQKTFLISRLQVIWENMIAFEKFRGADYATGCLLGYPYFKNYYRMIAIDLGKQQALDADPEEIQQISFTGNLN